MKLKAGDLLSLRLRISSATRSRVATNYPDLAHVVGARHSNSCLMMRAIALVVESTTKTDVICRRN